MSEVAEALPQATPAEAGAAVDPATKALTEQNRAIDAAEGENTDPPEDDKPAKPEKTPEQREIERLRRGIDRRTRQLAELRAQQLTQRPIEAHNRQDADDSQPLTLSRSEIAQLVRAEAEKLAPTIATQQSEFQRKQGVIESLAKTWGQEKFDEVASDLDAAFGGLRDASGRVRPAMEAVFEAENPVRVVEWLADPENAEEAERISGLDAVRAGVAIARLERRIEAEDEKHKPRASKAPTPIAPARGSAPVTKSLADMPYDEFVKRRKEMVAARQR